MAVRSVMWSLSLRNWQFNWEAKPNPLSQQGENPMADSATSLVQKREDWSTLVQEEFSGRSQTLGRFWRVFEVKYTKYQGISKKVIIETTSL